MSIQSTMKDEETGMHRKLVPWKKTEKNQLWVISYFLVSSELLRCLLVQNIGSL